MKKPKVIILLLLVVIIILCGSIVYVVITKKPTETRATITIMSVERKSFDTDIWDNSKPGFFQINVAEKITFPNGESWQSFVVMDPSIAIQYASTFRKLFNFPQYWGKFKAEVELSVDPTYVQPYNGMPVLVDVFKIITPTAWE